MMTVNTVAEENGAWNVLMGLKEAVELVLSPTFDDESVNTCKLRYRITDKSFRRFSLSSDLFLSIIIWSTIQISYSVWASCPFVDYEV